MKGKNFKKTRALLMGTMLGASLLVPYGGNAGTVEASGVDGKCSITIDANINQGSNNLAYGTGKCKDHVFGEYANGNYVIYGAEFKHVKNGQVELIRIPPFETYELTVYTVKPGEKPKPEPKPEPKPDAGIVFSDVPKSYWAYKDIMKMHDEGVIYGYTDGTFKPHQSISRTHVAMLFARSLELKPIREGKEFRDVSKSHRAYADIQKVYRAGIFDGKGNGDFGVEDNLTRAQMAKVLTNAFDLELYKGNVFSDVGESHWAKDYVSTLYKSGITVGSNGRYLPNDYVSRAHYAVFLNRALNQDGLQKPEVK